MTQNLYLSLKINLVLYILNLQPNFSLHQNYSVLTECHKNLFDVNLGLTCKFKFKM